MYDDTRWCLLAAVVAPRTSKIIVNRKCFWKRRKFATKWCIKLYSSGI